MPTWSNTRPRLPSSLEAVLDRPTARGRPPGDGLAGAPRRPARAPRPWQPRPTRARPCPAWYGRRRDIRTNFVDMSALHVVPAGPGAAGVVPPFAGGAPALDAGR